MKYWNTKRRAVAALAIVLHAIVVLNVWYADKLTPRVINMTAPVCAKAPSGIYT